MASLMEELLITMEGETEQYQKIIDLSDKKKDSIIHQKLEELESVTTQEQEIAGTLGMLEKKRTKLLRDIAVVMGQDDQQITVSWMIDNLADQPLEQERLRTAKNILTSKAHEMQELNLQSQALLRQALEMVEFDITLVKSMKQAPQTSNYGRDAQTTGALLGRSGFDAKQ